MRCIVHPQVVLSGVKVYGRCHSVFLTGLYGRSGEKAGECGVVDGCSHRHVLESGAGGPYQRVGSGRLGLCVYRCGRNLDVAKLRGTGLAACYGLGQFQACLVDEAAAAIFLLQRNLGIGERGSIGIVGELHREFDESGLVCQRDVGTFTHGR